MRELILFELISVKFNCKIILQGNVKQFLRLTTTVAPVEYVLGIRRAVLEMAGVSNFDRELRLNGFKVSNRGNFRYILFKAICHSV